MADRLIMPREDKFSDVPMAARKYLADLERKRQSMNSRSAGSGDEYVKGQVRTSKGAPKRVTKKAPTSSASKSKTGQKSSTPPPWTLNRNKKNVKRGVK